MTDLLTDRRKLTTIERNRVTYRARLLFDHLPQVQTECSRAYLIDKAIDCAELGQPLKLPGDGRSIKASRMLTP